MNGASLLGLDGAAGWLVDTLVATSLLVLLVLLVRRPVARLCGPRLAYALWALPAARLILPPLPSIWPAHEAQVATLATPAATEATTLWLAPAGSMVAAANDAAMSFAGLLSVELLLLIVALLWAAGAAVAMTRLWVAHRRMLASLDDAELLEWNGRVRLYRSGAITGPLAFGLMEPAIVLPDDERLPLTEAERALAIRHELAHHSRGDLWANAFAVLFAALHWFHPLLGRAWRAFRFDQEAACDATVLARATPEERALYARTLAKAATGRTSAFASPMIGKERLKERLSMLAQPPASALRRRTGAALAAVSAIGLLAFTASPVSADPAVPAPPAPPAAPAALEAPEPPAPPVAPERRSEVRVITIDRSQDDGDHVTRIVRDNGTTVVLRTNRPLGQAQVYAMVAEADASMEAAEAASAAMDAAREEVTRHRISIHRSREAQRMDRAEVAAMVAHARAQARTAIAEARLANGHARTLIRARACDDEAEAELFDSAAGDDAARPRVRLVRCVQGVVTPQLQIEAMRRARSALASMDSRHLPPEARDSALAELDEAIAAAEAEASRTTSD